MNGGKKRRTELFLLTLGFYLFWVRWPFLFPPAGFTTWSQAPGATLVERVARRPFPFRIALGGVPGVLIAVYVVTSLLLTTLKGIVIAFSILAAGLVTFCAPPARRWPTNLSECFEPLFDLVKGLAETGRRTAQRIYGAGGWVHHFNTDLRRPTAPMGWYGYFETWAGAGAWLSSQLWEHYLYTGDEEFLKQAYPIMKGTAQFFLDTLVEHLVRKWLVTCPSNSPENWYKAEGNPRDWKADLFEKGLITTIAAGPTIDLQILQNKKTY